MTFWSRRNFRVVTGGSWIRKPLSDDPDDPSLRIDGVSTDTRSLRPGQAFIALKGPRFNGHDYLRAAAVAGSPLLIVDEPSRVPTDLACSPNAPAILRVPDALGALGRLGAAYRKTLANTRVIAVCGSNGKTTTTRLIHSVLSTRLRGTASAKSFNNEIGVPLTVLGASPADQYLVCEVGTNAPGEVAKLGRIAQPDIAVITSIGRAHIEFFDSVAAVAREDASIFADLAPGGVAIVPAAEPHLADFLKPVPNVLTFGEDASADLRCSSVEHTRLPDGRTGLRFVVNDRQAFVVPLLGAHNALNAMAAVAVARRLGLDDASIARGLEIASPADMRLNRRSLGGLDLFIDCYNANPESARAAVRTFAALTPSAKRRVLVLGDMLELGSHAPACHRELGEIIRDHCPADLVITVGPLALHTAEALSDSWPASRFVMLSSLDEAQSERVVARLRPGDAVLLKGSRAVKLEQVVAALEKHAAPPAGPNPAASPLRGAASPAA